MKHLWDDIFMKNDVDVGHENVNTQAQDILDDLELGGHHVMKLRAMVLELLCDSGLGDVERTSEPRVEVRVPSA